MAHRGMIRFLEKYDWVKIGGLPGILALDALIVIGIVNLFSCNG